MILIATPERSGTRRLAFDICGTERRGMRPITERHMGGCEVLYSSLSDREMPLVEAYANEMLIVTTGRPYADIRASWVRNGMDLGELETKLANHRRLMELQPY